MALHLRVSVLRNQKILPNPALNPVRFALWTRRDKAAPRRLALRYFISDHPMTYLEFITAMTQALAWPMLIFALLFYYRDKLTEFAIEMQGTKLQVKLVKSGEAPKANQASLAGKHETAYFKRYSNGVLVQNLKIRVMPGIEKLPLTYPMTFPNELLSIQIIGEDAAWTTRASLGNCDLRVAPSSHERELQLRISGI